MDFSERYPDSSSTVSLAVRRGDVTVLKQLIEQGKSLETRDNRGWRPIHEASHWDHGECLRLLLETNDFQVNAQTFEGQTALWLAVDNNSLEAAQILVEAGALVNLPNNEDVTPLHRCSGKGFREMTELLLKNGANPNIQDFGGCSPLHEAALANKYLVIELLLLNGADKSIREDHCRTALFCACESDSCESVKLLLEQSTPGFVNSRASDGATGLMLSSQKGCFDCVQLLISYGANPNLKAHDGVMAVHLALVNDNEQLLRFLIRSTDRRLIEQVCLLGYSSSEPFSGTPFRYPDQGITEGENIFKMAITKKQLHLLKLLVEEGLQPDCFPCLPPNRDAHPKSFLTPLGFILLTASPFSNDLLEAVEYLINNGSCSTALQRCYMSPLECLFYGMNAADFADQCQASLYLKALEALIEKGALLHLPSVRMNDLSDLMVLSLKLRPDAFLFILHKGYLFDDISCRKACNDLVISMEIFQEGSVSKQALFYKVICEIFASGMLTDWRVFSGFPIDKIPSETGYEKFLQSITHRTTTALSLKQLCRKAVRSTLLQYRVKVPIPNLAIPLPQSLINYLCYHDMQF